MNYLSLKILFLFLDTCKRGQGNLVVDNCADVVRYAITKVDDQELPYPEAIFNNDQVEEIEKTFVEFTERYQSRT